MVRVYESDWLRMATRQLKLAAATGQRPTFADLIREALDRLEES